jgi:F-type H+-transporting ATPase subunit c
MQLGKALASFGTFVITMLISLAVLAEETGAEAAAEGGAGGGGELKFLAAAIAIGLAAFGGSLGQSKAASAALEGIARNPNASSKIFTPMILALALIESLVIYALIIAFMLVG